MAGQPTFPGWLEFDVTNLEVIESSGVLNNIIDVGEEFTLRVTFTGSGTDWDTTVADHLPFEVLFYLEGIGVAAPDFDFPVVNGTLMTGVLTYTAEHTVVGGIAEEGIYKCGVVVQIPGKPGVLGFIDNLLIQINELEE